MLQNTLQTIQNKRVKQGRKPATEHDNCTRQHTSCEDSPVPLVPASAFPRSPAADPPGSVPAVSQPPVDPVSVAPTPTGADAPTLYGQTGGTHMNHGERGIAVQPRLSLLNFVAQVLLLKVWIQFHCTCCRTLFIKPQLK